MEFKQLLEDRRSIRDYAAGACISKEELAQMIYAAQQAPSWKNSQTGRYYAVISDDKREVFRKECLPGFNFERTENAAAFIVTAFKKGFSGFTPDGTPTDEHGDGWGAYDLGLQTQNLLLAARELGFDTLIMGLRNEAKIREMLCIPEDEKVMSVIAVGKRASQPQKPDRNAVEAIVKFF